MNWQRIPVPLLLASWRMYVRRLAVAKKTETVIRKAVVSRLFPDPHKGVNYDESQTVKLVPRVNITIDETLLHEALAKAGEQWPDVNVGAAFKWKPAIVQKEFDELPPEVRNFIEAEAFTYTPGLPAVEFVKE